MCDHGFNKANTAVLIGDNLTAVCK